MSEFKGTKGKWEINPKASRNVRCNNLTIANCSSGQNGENEIEEKANALLISKAPEMLEILKELISAFEGDNLELYQQIRIEKAKKLIKESTKI
jgi:hypothetical protein